MQLVTSKLDQAHGKAREIEAIVIASIAFDNRFCHALTLNRDLVVFDLLGALETYNMERRGGAGGSCGARGSCRGGARGEEERGASGEEQEENGGGEEEGEVDGETEEEGRVENGEGDGEEKEEGEEAIERGERKGSREDEGGEGSSGEGGRSRRGSREEGRVTRSSAK